MFDHVLEELIEWAEDVATRAIGSRVVVVPVPPGWGRTSLLSRLGSAVDAWPNTLRVEVSGRSCPQGDGPAAEWLWGLSRRDRLPEGAPHRLPEGAPHRLPEGAPHRLPEGVKDVVAVDSREGFLQLAEGVAALTAAPALAGPAGLLVAVGLTAEPGLHDLLFPNPAARARQAGRRLGALSTRRLVLVEIDDAEMLPSAIVEAFLTGLVDRFRGQALAVLVADPSSDLATRLEHLPSPSVLAEGLRSIGVPDASMDLVARRDVITRSVPQWPSSATNRLAEKTRTFSDIYTVLHHSRAEAVSGCTEPVLEVDRLVISALPVGPPSNAEIIVAWSGGEIHEQQLAAALAVLRTDSAAGRLTRSGGIVRLADPAKRAELCEHVLAVEDRLAMAQAIAAVASTLIRDRTTDWVSKVGLLRPIPALIDSEDLPLTAPTLELVTEFVALLSGTGDLQAAGDLATRTTAMAMHTGASRSSLQRLAAVTFALAVVGNASGAVAGLALEVVDPDNAAVFDVEAQLWATICLLQNSATRGHGLAAGTALLPRLDPDCLGTAALEWRLQFAAAAARAEAYMATLSALAPLFALPDGSGLRQLAEQVMTLPHDRAADYGIAITLLERDLANTPSENSEDLRLHLTLAKLYQRIENWHDALRHQSLAMTHIEHLSGPDHPETLHIRYDLATCVARTGDAWRALRLFEDLLPDFIRVRGAENNGTLALRADIANLAGLTGNARRAVQLFDALLADQLRVLGDDDPDTLAIRDSLATWTGQAGDPSRAVQLYKDLLSRQIRVLGPDHPLTLATRNNVALRTAQIGVGTRALHLYKALLPDAVRILGADHPHTLATRGNIAAWTGQTGDPSRAVQLYEDLLADQVRVLGTDHPDTLATRNSIASWVGRAGDAERARQLSEALLREIVPVLGPDHPHTLATRDSIAAWTGHAGNPGRALQLYEDLLPRQSRVLGHIHPLTLATRDHIAFRTAQISVGQRARQLYEALLPGAVRILGPDHPQTLATRGNIAASTGQAGDPSRAVQLYEDLLVDQVRVLGTDHPDTLATRVSIASWIGRAGNATRALHLFEALLPDMVRVLGLAHPKTLATRGNIAAWAGQAGDPIRALQLYKDLLKDQVRVLGTDHPDTLATRKNIPSWVGRAGNDKRALQLLENVLPDLVRVLGNDHPDTLATRTQITSMRNGIGVNSRQSTFRGQPR